MKKLLAPLLVSLAVLLLGGCANHIEAATAGLRADLVQLKQTASGDIQVTWRVRNPNVVGYVLTRNSIKITLDGVSVGTITGETRFGIPALNQADQINVLTVSEPAARQAVSQAIARGSANYTLDATLWLLVVDDDIEKFSLAGSGTVPASAE